MIKQFFLKIDDYISVFALSLIIFITFLNVILRFIFKNSFHWNEEIVLGLFIWLAFISVSTVMKKDGHVGIDYFVNKTPPLIKKFLIYLRYIVIYFTLIVVFVYLGTSIALETSQVTSVLSISQTYIYIAIPISGVLSIIYLTIYLMKKKREDREEC